MRLITFLFLLNWIQPLLAQDVGQWAAADTAFDSKGRIKSIEEVGGKNSALYYEYDSEGHLLQETYLSWKNNIQYERVTAFYVNGKTKEEYFYFVVAKTFYGKPILDSVYSVYDEKGVLIQTTSYQDNKRNGPFIAYYPNRNIKMKTSYQNDVLHGLSFTYYPDGAIASELAFDRGRLIKAKYFTQEGIEFLNPEFSNGNGTLVMYEFGIVVKHCIVKNGKLKKCHCPK